MKEKKDSKVFRKPTLKESIDFCESKGYSCGEVAFNYYDAMDWEDVIGNPVKNWKTKYITVWFKDQYKIQEAYKIEDLIATKISIESEVVKKCIELFYDFGYKMPKISNIEYDMLVFKDSIKEAILMRRTTQDRLDMIHAFRGYLMGGGKVYGTMALQLTKLARDKLI